jgi:signal transduction histidine kinase
MSHALRRALGESQADLELLASHLGLIQGVLDASDHALSLNELCARLAAVFVAELGFEQVGVFLCGSGSEPEVAGWYSQTERFGGPSTAVPQALAELAREVVSERSLLRWGGGGVGPRRRLPKTLEGSVVGLPIASRGLGLGAVVCVDVAPRRWTLAAQRALDVVSQIVGRILATAEARFALDALHHELEVELSAASARLARQERNLREHAGRIHELSTALAKASRVRDTFLGFLSHELRTPVAAITGYAAILREGGAGPTTPEQSDFLARIEANGRQLGRLLEDVLFLTEAESQQVEPRFESVEVGRIVEEIAGSVPRLQEPDGPELEVSIAGAAARAETDPRLLGRALFHLLDHVTAGGPSDVVRIDVGTEAETIRIGLDTSGGAAAEKPAAASGEHAPPGAPRPADETSHAIGTGLGLGLVRLCIALLGGRYTVAAKAGGGTSAEIWLPNRGPEPIESPAAERTPRRRSGGSGRTSRPPAAASGGARAVTEPARHLRAAESPTRRKAS